MRFFYFALFLLLTTLASGQTILSGKIIDSASKLPVPGASVYINNSSIGTITNSSGDFSLAINFTGQVGLVVSHVAFQLQNIPVRTGITAKKLLIGLVPKNAVLNEVTITGNPLTGWKKWRRLFTEYFIGKLEFAKKCRIINPETLIFHYDKTNEVLTVTARDKLLIENRALGYLYNIDIKSFNYSFKTLMVETGVTTFFQDIQPINKDEEKTFLINRKQAFFGSKMHFIQSVYNKDYLTQGFAVTAVHLKKNPGKYRITQMISQAQAKAYLENKNINTVTIESIAGNNKDSVALYNQKLAETDFIIRDTTRALLTDSLLFFKNQSASLLLKDTLLIQYTENNVKPVRLELPVKNASFNIADKQASRKTKLGMVFQYSMMLSTSAKEVTIYPNGSYDGNYLFTDGYMAFGKMAYSLPWDYKIEN